MSTSAGRRRPCNRTDAVVRARQASAFLGTAVLVGDKTDQVAGYDYDHVAAALAVLASIAASDAICCTLLGEQARGQDHRQAVALLGEVRFGAGGERAQVERTKKLKSALSVALDIKDEAHYGATMLGREEVRRLMRAATTLVDAASEVTGRR